ncbi:MAG: hypothetical protein GXP05_16110 [Alphaproteobacteria bacterium]|nr:hypothetical protein [Alphaproteobacteria bacterium]
MRDKEWDPDRCRELRRTEREIVRVLKKERAKETRAKNTISDIRGQLSRLHEFLSKLKDKLSIVVATDILQRRPSPKQALLLAEMANARAAISQLYDKRRIAEVTLEGHRNALEDFRRSRQANAAEMNALNCFG